MAGLSLEAVLTHPDAFGLTTATPVQRAVCRVCDGRPLGELADDPDVRWALGEDNRPGALAALPRAMPQSVYLVGAARGGKTLLSGAVAFRSAVTCNVSQLRPGEVPRYSIVSLDIDKASVALEHLLTTIQEKRFLKPFFVDATRSSVILRHISSTKKKRRRVEIKVVAGKRSGASVVSRWSAGVTFDEAPRMQGQADGVVNFDEQRKASIARLLPGAQLFAPGSPWAPRGPIFDAVEQAWGKPTPGLVVVRAKGPQLNPMLWTPEFIEKIRTGPDGEIILQTDCWAEFGGAEGTFLSPEDVRKATPPDREVALPFDPSLSYAAFQDPATRGNAWTLVIVGRRDNGVEGEDTYTVARIAEWRGSPSKPLKAREVFAEMLPILREYHIDEVHTDRWSSDLVVEAGEAAHVTVLVDGDSEEDKSKRYLDLKQLIVAEPARISFPPDAQFRADLLSIRRTLTAQGMRFPLPITGDGRHADYAPALVGAVARAASGPSWIAACAKYAAVNPDVYWRQ